MLERPGGSVASQISWLPLGEGLRLARERGCPALLNLEPDWTTSAQRLSLLCDRDKALAAVLDATPCIRVDPLDEPDMAAELRARIAELAGFVGPPAMAVLDGNGVVLAPFTSLAFEGQPGHPSLAAVLQASSDYLGGAALPPSGGSGPGNAGEHLPYVVEAGSLELPDGGSGSSDAQKDRLKQHMDRLLRSGMRDHIGAGFFRACRDSSGVVPHFEKLLPQNAEIAAALARAASILEDTELLAVADRTFRFVADLFLAEPSRCAIAADSHYYTWTPREFADVVPRAASKSASLYFNMTRAQVPHSLFAARTLNEVAAFGRLTQDAIAKDIEVARKALYAARSHRPAPAIVTSGAIDWPARTIAGLARAIQSGCSGVAASDVADSLKQLRTERFDTSDGWCHSDGRTAGRTELTAIEDAGFAVERMMSWPKDPAGGHMAF